MEDKATMVIHSGPGNQIRNGQKKKKRFSLFKTALVMVRGRPAEKPKVKKLINAPKADDNNTTLDENWKKVVGSMRPLHSQDIRSPPPPISAAFRPLSRESSNDDLFGVSPSLSTTSWGTSSYYGSTDSLQDLAGSGRLRQSESSSSLCSKMSENLSRYASALNLHDLDVDEKVDEDVADDNDDHVLENYFEADDMIDSKADEFIARFYDQMKSQQ